MASIVADGVVVKTPYAILQNFNFERPFTLTIKAAAGGIRDWPTGTRLIGNVFVYDGETVVFKLQTPANGTYTCFNFSQVNSSTGAVTVSNAITIPQRSGFSTVQVGVTLDASTWVPTLAVSNY